ncbi:MAG: hypothetical protein ACK5Q5_12620 [Planctomycetaceae bacterium]
MPLIHEQKQAAKLLGVTTRTLRDWRAANPDFPDTTNGYDIEAINRWRAAHEAKGSDEADLAAQLNKAIKVQKLRREKALADRAEREERIAQGNILARDEHETSFREIITVARDRLISLPKQLARLVPHKDRRRLQAEGDKLVRNVLDEMSRQFESMDEEQG